MASIVLRIVLASGLLVAGCSMEGIPNDNQSECDAGLAPAINDETFCCPIDTLFVTEDGECFESEEAAVQFAAFRVACESILSDSEIVEAQETAVANLADGLLYTESIVLAIAQCSTTICADDTACQTDCVACQTTIIDAVYGR